MLHFTVSEKSAGSILARDSYGNWQHRLTQRNTSLGSIQFLNTLKTTEGNL